MNALPLTYPPRDVPHRKPLAPINGWSNVLAPKSAFKTPGITPGGAITRRVSFKPDPAVANDAAWQSLETPAQRPAASRRRVTHRRAGMRARKGTGRAVAARTFSLVLRAPHERVEAAAARVDERDASFDGSRANGARSMSASADSAGDGSGGSVKPGDAFDEARDLGYFTSARKVDSAPEIDDTFSTDPPSAIAAGRPSLVPYALTPTEEGTFAHGAAGAHPNVQRLNDVHMDDDDDFGGGFGGGFDDDVANDDADAFFGATPGDAKMLVDGGNDPMTDRGDAKRAPLRKLTGAKRPAGTPHKRERKRFERRKSLTGAGLRDDLMETEDGRPLRRSTRERTAPLQYWRGETKKYSRVHQSLPTVNIVRTRTPNPQWPLAPTPFHAHGAGVDVVITDHVRDWSQKDSRRKKTRRPTEEESRRAGEEARKRALALADVAHLSDSELEDDEEEDDVEIVELAEPVVAAAEEEPVLAIGAAPVEDAETEVTTEAATADVTIDEEVVAPVGTEEDGEVVVEEEQPEEEQPKVVVVEEGPEAVAPVEEPEEETTAVPAPTPLAVDDAVTEEVPAVGPAPDVDVTAAEEEDAETPHTAPAIEPVAEEEKAAAPDEDDATADADVVISDADDMKDANDDDVFKRPESPARRVTRRSARADPDDATEAEDAEEERLPSTTTAAGDIAENVTHAHVSSPPRTRVTRRVRSASLASTGPDDADVTVDVTAELEEVDVEEVDTDAKTVSPPRRSTRRSARNAGSAEGHDASKTVSPKSTGGGRRVTRRSSRAASVAGDLDETVRVDEE